MAERFEIYRATRIASGKAYIGLTRHGMIARQKQHGYVAEAFKTGRAAAARAYPFQRALARYGMDAFRWEVLYVATSKREAVAVERALIAAYGTLRPNGYNLVDGGEGSEGIAPEVRARMSAKKRGRPLSEEHKKRIGLAGKGKKRSPEFGARISAAKKGKKLSQEARDKMSLAWRTRQKPSPEAIAKSAASRRGLKRSASAIAKTAEANRGRKNTPEAIERMRAAALARERPELTAADRIALAVRSHMSQATRSASGIRGVRFRKGKWEANAKLGGRQHYLGVFATAELASAAYEKAATEHFASLTEPGPAAASPSAGVAEHSPAATATR